MTADKQIDELLPCPFCGGPVALERAHETRDPIMGIRKWWGVVCRNTTNLGGTCCIEQVPSASERAAIERWNRRATTAPAVEKEASGDIAESNATKLVPCVHVNEPKACYRVRCQLGNKCVDDDMSPRAESENRSTGICFFCSHPIDGAHEEDCPQAAATAPDRHSILYEAGEALLAAEHHEAYEVLYRMMEECRSALSAPSPEAPADSIDDAIEEVQYVRSDVSPTVGDSAGEPVATLHDDGYWTWKKGAPPYKSNYAGWRMDVYAHPPAQTADVRAMALEEAAMVCDQLWKRAGDADECADAIRALLEQKP